MVSLVLQSLTVEPGLSPTLLLLPAYLGLNS